MLIGGVNAYTGETGKVTNVLSGERSQPIAKVARAYQAGKQSWVIIGGNNYGEGSSREHAAITPRYLGCAAVIARSFARIHESNLKKQGLLALTFRNPDDYDRIREDDRISLPAAINLVPGADVECVIKHADGSQETVKLAHTLSEEHIRWFRAGSALNALNSK
jgi:aconitate hydratase